VCGRDEHFGGLEWNGDSGRNVCVYAAVLAHTRHHTGDQRDMSVSCISTRCVFTVITAQDTDLVGENLDHWVRRGTKEQGLVFVSHPVLSYPLCAKFCLVLAEGNTEGFGGVSHEGAPTTAEDWEIFYNADKK
jgi:hypothetical protein